MCGVRSQQDYYVPVIFSFNNSSSSRSSSNNSNNNNNNVIIIIITQFKITQPHKELTFELQVEKEKTKV